jgi:plasmid stabilization system protein ParE
MKVRASFLTVASSAVVLLVSAYTHSRMHALPADSLARFEAITSYCEKTDPASAAEYASKLVSFTRRHSEDELAGDRSSAKYRNALADANATLAAAAMDTGLRGCNEFLAEQ